MIYYFLPFIVLMGLFTSYQDIRQNKIKNWWVVYAVGVSVLLNILLFLKEFDKEYCFSFAINLAITIIVCIALWVFKFWPAGDAKLIIAYAFLLPLVSYPSADAGYLQPLFLFINIFVPYTLCILFYFAIFKMNLSIETLKKISLVQVSKAMLLVLVMFYPVSLALSTAGINDFLSRIILAMFLYYFSRKLFMLLFKESIFAYLAILLAEICFVPDFFLSSGFIYSFGIYCAIFVFLSSFMTGITDAYCREKYLPFAPFAFIGALLTVVCKGMFIYGLLILLKAVGW